MADSVRDELRVTVLAAGKHETVYLVSEYRSGGRKPLTRRVIANRYGTCCSVCTDPSCSHVEAVMHFLRTRTPDPR